MYAEDCTAVPLAPSTFQSRCYTLTPQRSALNITTERTATKELGTQELQPLKIQSRNLLTITPGLCDTYAKPYIKIRNGVRKNKKQVLSKVYVSPPGL